MKKNKATSKKSVPKLAKLKYIIIGLLMSLSIIIIFLFALLFLDMITLNFPPFNKMAGIDEKISESGAKMTGLYDAEMVYFDREGTFSGDLEELGFETNTLTEDYHLILYADKYGFVARALGNLDDDDFFDIWVITDESSEPTHVANDLYNIGEYEGVPYIKKIEARRILSGIFISEETYFAEENTYNTDPNYLGFEVLSELKYYKWEILYADDVGFLAVCWGNIDKDVSKDVWIAHEDDREPFHLFDDLNDIDNREHLSSDYYDAGDGERGILEAFLEGIGMGGK